MNYVTLLGILAGIIVVILALKLRFARIASNLASSPSGQVTLEDVKRLALAGRKIEAIQAYRLVHPISLKAAKDAVERLMAGQSLPEERGESGAAEEFEEVRQLAAQGRKIEAIKRYRELTYTGLVDAKYAVESGNYIHPLVAGSGDEPNLEAVRATARAGEVIKAIKMYQTLHPSAGLAEAKAMVEKLQAEEA